MGNQWTTWWWYYVKLSTWCEHIFAQYKRNGHSPNVGRFFFFERTPFTVPLSVTISVHWFFVTRYFVDWLPPHMATLRLFGLVSSACMRCTQGGGDGRATRSGILLTAGDVTFVGADTAVMTWKQNKRRAMQKLLHETGDRTPPPARRAHDDGSGGHGPSIGGRRASPATRTATPTTGPLLRQRSRFARRVISHDCTGTPSHSNPWPEIAARCDHVRTHNGAAIQSGYSKRRGIFHPTRTHVRARALRHNLVIPG